MIVTRDNSAHTPTFGSQTWFASAAAFVPDSRTGGGVHDVGWDGAMNRLLDWIQHPEELEEEGIRPPTRALLNALASKVHFWTHEPALSAPTGLVPNGEGGVVFSWLRGPEYVELEIDEGRNAEFRLFRHARLVERTSLPVVLV